MARVHFGLTSEEFFQLQPRQFHSLEERHGERVEHQELLAGVVASTIVNWSQFAPKEGRTPSSFMPSRWKAGKPRKRIDRKKIANDVRTFFFEPAMKAQARQNLNV